MREREIGEREREREREREIERERERCPVSVDCVSPRMRCGGNSQQNTNKKIVEAAENQRERMRFN